MFRRIVVTASVGLIAASAVPAFAAGPLPVVEEPVIMVPEAVIVPSADWTGRVRRRPARLGMGQRGHVSGVRMTSMRR